MITLVDTRAGSGARCLHAVLYVACRPDVQSTQSELIWEGQALACGLICLRRAVRALEGLIAAFRYPVDARRAQCMATGEHHGGIGGAALIAQHRARKYGGEHKLAPELEIHRELLAAGEVLRLPRHDGGQLQEDGKGQ